MANGFQVQSKLMAAAGNWVQFDSRATFSSFEYSPARDGLPAVHVIDNLPRWIVYVLAHGQVDFTFIHIHDAADHCDVSLLDFAVVKLTAQLAVGLFIERHDDHSGRIPVESMDDAGGGIRSLHAGGKTVGFLRSDAGHGKHAAWLIQHDEAIVAVNDGRQLWKRHPGRIASGCHMR